MSAGATPPAPTSGDVRPSPPTSPRPCRRRAASSPKQRLRLPPHDDVDGTREPRRWSSSRHDDGARRCGLLPRQSLQRAQLAVASRGRRWCAYDALEKSSSAGAPCYSNPRQKECTQKRWRTACSPVYFATRSPPWWLWFPPWAFSTGFAWWLRSSSISAQSSGPPPLASPPGPKRRRSSRSFSLLPQQTRWLRHSFPPPPLLQKLYY
mmetsp:Transcript_17259/g.42832  ORF Transcript_17259/g.42832 Transcript_17259/m.42832 type:complete len:208 (-) Transcript_17259:2681-3304(-)